MTTELNGVKINFRLCCLAHPIAKCWHCKVTFCEACLTVFKSIGGGHLQLTCRGCKEYTNEYFHKQIGSFSSNGLWYDSGKDWILDQYNSLAEFWRKAQNNGT